MFSVVRYSIKTGGVPLELETVLCDDGRLVSLSSHLPVKRGE